MTSILERQVTSFLTTELGRAPTTAEISRGLISPWTLAQIHNSLNVTQSVFSVSPGDDLQAAIDKLVLNGGGVLFLNPGLYSLVDHLISYSNIHIKGVGSGGSTLDFGNLAKQIQIVGTGLDPINSAFLEGFTVQNSSVALIEASYTNNFGGTDIECVGGLVGLSIDNSTIFNWNINTIDSCGTGILCDTLTGFTIDNAFVTNISSVGAYVFSNSSNGVLVNSSLDTVVGKGYSFTSCSNVGADQISITNVTGTGFLLDDITGSFSVTNGLISNCSGDGMKLQNSSSELQVSTMEFSGNTGYGVNISDVGSSNNLFVGNTLKNNTLGNLHNLGTNTIFPATVNQFL